MHEAATAGLIGASIGFLGNALVTWITKHCDERKARRELLIKTAWDHYSSSLETLKAIVASNEALPPRRGKMMPFEIYVLYTARVVDLAMRKDLSDEGVIEEMRKIQAFERGLKKISNEAQA